MFIYKITNKLNGDFYVGKTEKTIERRFGEHLWCARKGKKDHFHRAIAKYGADNFIVECIDAVDDCTSEELCKKEIEWIAKLHPYYNMTIGGEGTAGLRYKRSDETKAKMSKSKKGGHWFYNPETLVESYRKTAPDGFISGRIPGTQGGKRGVYTKERSAKFRYWRRMHPEFASLGFLGKHHSDETKAKMAEAQRRRYAKTKSI